MSEEQGYSLAVSGQGVLGELYPVLKDAYGNIIDGFHRKGEQPNWHEETRPHIDTPVKLELARLAVNFARRKVSAEEFTQRIAFLVRAGMKPEEIAKETGISERTIYRHMPQELKNQVKSEAGKTKASLVTPVTTNLTSQDTAKVELVECENCRLAVSQSEIKNVYGHDVCSRCEPVAQRRFKPQVAKPEAKVVKPTETWEHRKAVMAPQHSRMEEIILSKLHEKGVGPVVTDREFCLSSTTPDFYFPSRNLAVYLDGPVHEGREDRDEELRESLTKRHGLRVVSIPYDGSSQQEVDRVLEQITQEA